MPPRTVDDDDPEQLLGDAGMVDRKREAAINELLIGDDLNPFEALGLSPAPLIEQKNEMSKETIGKAFRTIMKEHHPDRFTAKIKKERGASPEPAELEESLIQMRRATAGHEGLLGAFELKAQGWFGVFIIRHCEGRRPQEHS